MLWMLIRNSSIGSQIILYYCRKPVSKTPWSNWDKVWFEWEDFTSHCGGWTSRGLATFTTRLRITMTGVYCLTVWMCVCVLYDIWKRNSCSYLQKVQSNRNMLKISIKNVCIIYSMPKFRNITRLIQGFDSGPQCSRQAVSTYLSGSGRYLCWYGVATNHVVGVWLGTWNLNPFNKS